MPSLDTLVQRIEALGFRVTRLPEFRGSGGGFDIYTARGALYTRCADEAALLAFLQQRGGKPYAPGPSKPEPGKAPRRPFPRSGRGLTR